MLTLQAALTQLLGSVRPLAAAEPESIATHAALGRVLGSEVRSTLDVPPADNTSMDGYAVHSADVSAPGTLLPVSQRIPAGTVPKPLAKGSAARIFTGAPIPPGADAVVMQEQCVAQGDRVRIETLPVPGQWIRRRGEDVRSGERVLAAGMRLTPQAMGLAATVGAATLRVARRPRVALFSTGDELAMPGEPLKPGAIYNSNRYTLRGLIEGLGCECTDLGIVPDNLDATRDALRRAATANDLIVTSGGVSVGEADHLRPAVQLEGRIDLWQIAIKPGKPFAFGEVRRANSSDVAGESSAYFIGLPGNPVSSWVTFLLLVRPVLLHLQGATRLDAHAVLLRADFDWPLPDKRREFLRVRRNSMGGLDLFPNQSSGVLTSTVWADALVDNPPAHPIRQGDMVQTLLVSELLA